VVGIVAERVRTRRRLRREHVSSFIITPGVRLERRSRSAVPRLGKKLIVRIVAVGDAPPVLIGFRGLPPGRIVGPGRGVMGSRMYDDTTSKLFRSLTFNNQ
jgi:hypothetical protein